MMIVARVPPADGPVCPEGLFPAVCSRADDLGTQETNFGSKHQIDLYFIVETGEPPVRYEIRRRYTLSLHEKSNLRRDLESWRGARFTDEELVAGYEVDRCVGKACQVQIRHSAGTEGRTFANIDGIATPQKVAGKVPQLVKPAPAPAPAAAVTADEIPF